ncbi:MAG: hypothetical protein RL217_736 [Pseudomonadota bacterium]|jgi:nicotinate-nucleotide adenylyltransferase
MAKCANNHWALFGGTFDPVHIGHLRTAIGLREAGFSKVLLIPNRIPVHRPQPRACAQDRLNMLDLACQELDGIEVCSIELEHQEPSYSAVTVARLKKLHPEPHFTWVLGQDAWMGFEHWHTPQALLDEANLLIISRPHNDTAPSAFQQQLLQERHANLDELLQSPHGRIGQAHWPMLDISASSLRAALSQGDNIRFLTPDSVAKYLYQHQLYSN